MREGATFPPILVTRRPHTPEVLTVIDEFHRIEAALRHCEYERKHLHQTYLDAVVIRPYGDQEELEATLLVNTTHGLPLTKADNKRRLELAHTISRLRELPSRRLAQHLGGIHHSTISRWRQKNGFTLEDDDDKPFSPDPQAKFWQSSIRAMPTTPNRPKFPKASRTKPLVRLMKMLEDASTAAPENVEDTINRNVLKHKIRPQVVDATLLEVREIIDAILYARKEGRIINAIKGAEEILWPTYHDNTDF
jgi:hypothetical protein